MDPSHPHSQPQAFGIPLLCIPCEANREPKNPNLLPPGAYIFANAYSWVLFHQNPHFAEALRNAQGVFADGIGTLLAAQIHSHSLPPRVPGPNFTHKTLQHCPEKPMTFVGGSPTGFQKIQEKYSLQKAQHLCPPQRKKISPEDILEDLNPLSEVPFPQIFWVCLGSPKQEIWAHHASKILQNSHFFSVGAAFDFLSGEKKRAPSLLQNMGLEWAYRLFQEPQRLSQRYLLGNPLLLLYTLAFKIKPRKK